MVTQGDVPQERPHHHVVGTAATRWVTISQVTKWRIRNGRGTSRGGSTQSWGEPTRAAGGDSFEIEFLVRRPTQPTSSPSWHRNSNCTAVVDELCPLTKLFEDADAAVGGAR